MYNAFIWIIIVLISLLLAILSKVAIDNPKGKIWYSLEVYRHFVNYFITGVLGYFIIAIRWPEIAISKNILTSDFVLLLAFLMGTLGWWPYFIKNITEGLSELVERLIKKS